MYTFTINRILIVFASFLLMTFSLSGQNMQQRKFDPSQMQPVGKISGTIIDSQTSQPIEYGNIVLYRMRDSVVAGGTVTNAQGKYEIDKVMFGRYFLKVSYIGYTTIKIDTLTITPRNTEIKLGIIKLQPKNVSMNEVVVSGQRETINYNLDKKVFTVDKNFANSGGTAIDIIQNMPSVTVDADGGVAVRGNSNITILIDGRPSALSGFGNSDALQQIPASSIESVELITNPSAKYEAEGTGGILNIILKKQSNLGVNGTAMVNAGTGRKYNTSINLNLRSENFNLFGSYDGRFFNFFSSGNTLRNTTFEGTTNSLDQTSHNINSINNHNFNLGGDYFLADKEILTLSAQFRIGNFNSGSTIDNKNYLPDNSLQSYFQRLSNGNRNLNSGNYTLSYKKTFADKSRELTADVMYLTSSMNNDTKITQQYFNTGFGTVITNPSLQRSLSDNTNKTWLVQSNYIQPLENLGRFEGGFRSTIKDLRMSNNYLNFNYDASSWVNNSLTNNDYNYKEQVHALYGIYSNNFGGFAFQAGLRAEQAFINGKS